MTSLHILNKVINITLFLIVRRKSVFIFFMEEYCEKYPVSDVESSDSIIIKNSTVWHYSKQNQIYYRICCNLEQHTIEIWSRKKKSVLWNSVTVTDIKKDCILDLDCHGGRWEGDLWNGEPFGFGCLYNADNHLLYKGYIIGKTPICYGTEFYGECDGQRKYEGSFLNGMKHGVGVIYDMKDNVVYAGGCRENSAYLEMGEPIHDSLDFERLSIYILCLKVADNSCNLSTLSTFRLYGYPTLSSIDIGQNCFANVTRVDIQHCWFLETITIGSNSFCLENHTGSFFLNHCVSLRSISFGVNCFRYYESCHIESRLYH